MLSSSILATKILLISSGVVFLAMIIMKFTIIPLSINFIVSELPMIWSFFVSLSKPPYLYIVINGIIITIVASSRFSRTGTEMEGSSATMTPSSNLEHFQPLISARTRPLIEAHDEHDMFVHGVSNEVVVVMVDVIKNPVAEEAVVEVKVEEEVIERVEAPPPRMTDQPQESEVVLPVPRALSRFGPPKPSLEDKKEVKMEGGSIDGQQVTLESMWKTIMEGREEPLMNKCDLFDDDLEDENKETSSAPPSSQVRNPTSFIKGRTNYICESESPVKSWILKKEPSLGQDELNRRADAFIQQFNEEMRMQRQQSLMQNIKGELSY